MQPQLIPMDRFVSPNPGSPFGSRLVPRRPGYLVFLCVVSILLGTLGILRGGIANLARPQFGFRPQMQPRQVNSAEIAAARGRAIDSKYNSTHRMFSGAQALIGIVMIVGAYLLLTLRRPGDLLLRGAFVATLLVGVIHMVPFLFQMLEYQLLSQEIAAQANRVSPQEIAGMNQMAAITMLTAVVGTVVAIAWLVLKVALLGHGFGYLGKPEVQAVLR